jgi:hypothetical protein
MEPRTGGGEPLVCALDDKVDAPQVCACYMYEHPQSALFKTDTGWMARRFPLSLPLWRNEDWRRGGPPWARSGGEREKVGKRQVSLGLAPPGADDIVTGS